MSEGVEEAVEDDELGRHDVEGGVLVQRQEQVDTALAELGDGEPQHGQEYEHAGEVETLATSPGYHDGPVPGSININCLPEPHQPTDN